MSRPPSLREDHLLLLPGLTGLVLLSYAVLIAGCSLQGIVGLPPDKDGRTVYLEACASCHGPDGKGNGPVAKALTKPPADLTRLAERNGGTFPRQHVLEVITGEIAIPAHGKREMPVWSQRFSPSASGATVGASIYSQKHLDRVLSYLLSIQESGGTNAT